MAWHDLRHHRYTGCRLAHRHTSFGGLALLLGLMGLLLTVTNILIAQQGAAYSYPINVTAAVPGPPPADAPTIVTPSSGTTTNSASLVVEGGCQTGLNVGIQRNSLNAGSVHCAAGVYHLTVTILPGRNDLIARQYDALGQGSPSSATVSIYLASATSAELTPVSNRAASANAELSAPPLMLLTDYQYLGVFPQTKFSMWIELENGAAPYALSINWGDGTTSLLSQPHSGRLNADHSYASSGTYQVLATVSDVTRATAVIQTVVVVNGAVASAIAPSLAAGRMEIAWPVFMIAVTVASSFWLGEKIEIRRLGRRRLTDPA